ncbi:MAG: DUF6600 domain-containing protein [Syntrophales bacterium]
MKSLKSFHGWLICLFAAALLTALPAPAAETPALTVGRIFHIEGELFRYVPEENDWVAVVRDAPFGAEDTLFSGSAGMAELLVPNGLSLRIGNSTQIQFISLENDFAEMDVASGMARFSSNGQTALKVTSPFGYVLAEPGTIFDLYVGENSTETVAIKGTVSFVHPPSDSRYNVTSGAASIIADRGHISSGEGKVDADWNRWNMTRENFWLAKKKAMGPSHQYLPPELRNEAYTFEENGKWEKLFYEGRERWFWQPTAVAWGWSPFTVGRWTDWSGDLTWIPAEPFGYITHHYGNWVNIRNRWYWAPPIASWRIGLPFLDIGFFWYPGRVAWIYSGVTVGWVPLAPREIYYSRHPWGGPHTVVVNNINIDRISIDIRSHAYVDRAIIVDRRHFNAGDDYRKVLVTGMGRAAIIGNYRPAPVVGNAVIKNYTTNKQRYNYTNVKATEKPHTAAIGRINHNQALIREGGKGKTNHLEPAREINRAADAKLPSREINKRGAGKMIPAAPIEDAKPAPPAPRPAPKPERIVPAGPRQPDRPLPAAPKPVRMAPASPIQVDRPVQHPPARPAPKPERIVPAGPRQPDRPLPAAPKPVRMPPASPIQIDRPVQHPPARPAPKPERIVPEKPEQQKDSIEPEEPAKRPERTMPKGPGEKSSPQHPGTEKGERLSFSISLPEKRTAALSGN